MQEVSYADRKYKQEAMRPKKFEIIFKERQFIVETHEKLLGKFYRIEDVRFDCIRPKLVFCDTKEKKDIWKYFRIMASSLPYRRYRGRRMKYLLIDGASGCIMAVLGVGSDFKNLPARDKYIGWSKKDRFGCHVYEGVDIYDDGKIHVKGEPYIGNSGKLKKKIELGNRDVKLNHTMNIFAAVGIHPFSEMLVGKLVTMLGFSTQIMTDFEERYDEKLVGLVGLTITSLYKKSIQYDRIHFIKHIGFTSGKSSYHLSKKAMDKIINFFYKNEKEINKNRINVKKGQTNYKISSMVAKHLGAESTLIHNNIKGVYFGFCYRNSKRFLCNKLKYGGERYPENINWKEYEKMPVNGREKFWEEKWRKKKEKYGKQLIPIEGRKTEEIIEFWKKRWMSKRIPSRLNELEEKRFDFLNELNQIVSDLEKNHVQKKYENI